MENLDGLRARVGDIEAKLADVEAARGGLVAERDAEIARLTADRESAEQARADVAAKVPAELLALYDRQRARYGFGAVAAAGWRVDGLGRGAQQLGPAGHPPGGARRRGALPRQ